METFCTAGADGSITFWDGVGRTKLKGESNSRWEGPLQGRAGGIMRAGWIGFQIQVFRPLRLVLTVIRFYVEGIGEWGSRCQANPVRLTSCFMLLQPKPYNFRLVSRGSVFHWKNV